MLFVARNEERGLSAVKDLEKEGLKPKFHQLDITDHQSIVKLKEYIVDKYGGLDVLINNAGIAYKVTVSDLLLTPQPTRHRGIVITTHCLSRCLLLLIPKRVQLAVVTSSIMGCIKKPLKVVIIIQSSLVIMVSDNSKCCLLWYQINSPSTTVQEIYTGSFNSLDIMILFGLSQQYNNERLLYSTVFLPLFSIVVVWQLLETGCIRTPRTRFT